MKYSGSTDLTMTSTSISTRVLAPDIHGSRRRLAPRGASLMSGVLSPAGDGSSRMQSSHRDPAADLRNAVRFATWNVLTLNGDGFQEALVNELARYNVTVAGIQEARLPGHDQHVVNGATIIHSGGSDHTQGVALILRPPLNNSLVLWHHISPRLLYARLVHRRGHLSVIVAYAPTENSDDVTKDTFYDQLADTIHSVPPHDELLVLGDMNANPGPRRSGFEDVVGPFGLDSVNDNSDRLLSLCSSVGLSATGTWFQRRDIHRLSWISNDGTTKKELDHVLARPLRIVKSYRVFRGAEAPANTDHRLLVATVAVPFRPAYKPKPKPMLNVQALRDDMGLQRDYNIAIQNSFSALEDLPEDVESAWSLISNAITGVAKEVVGYRQHRRKPWLSDEAMDLVNAKARARLNGAKSEYKRLQGVFKAKAKQDREEYLQSLVAVAEQGLQENNLRTTYSVIRQIRGLGNNKAPVPVTKSDGTPCSGQSEILQRWREHFMNALNHPPATPCNDLREPNTPTACGTISSDAPTLAEVRTAIQKLRHGRAAGPDGIPPELLKCALNPVSEALHQLFLRVWSTGQVPADWKSGIILALYKGKGHRNECSSYRPITLLSVPGKVFAHVLLARLQPLLTPARRPQQSGFTAGRSTMDAILALRLLSEIHREFRRPLHVAYVDLKSAFDSVDRQALWKALQGVGVPDTILGLITALHEGTTAKVRINGVLSDEFLTASGVRQGCVLAPTLFCRAMDWILERVSSLSGIQLPEHDFHDLDYADDVALLDASPTNLASTLDHLESEASHLGLHVSWQKTKLQNLDGMTSADDISVRGHTVEAVDEFVYLGSLQTSDGRCLPDITRRIGLAASAMRSLQDVWRQQRTKLETKLAVYRTCVLPVLLYGAETWTLLAHDISKLEAFHMHCQRQLLHVRWYDFVPNSNISATTQLPCISDVIARRRSGLFGHVARLHCGVPARDALDCTIARRSERRPPAGWKRPSGRPRQTWITQIGDGTPSGVIREFNRASGRGHTRSALRSSDGQAF